MKKKDLDRFKEILVDEKTKILRHLEDLSQSSGADMENSMSGDSADIATIEMNQANNYKIGKREATLIKKIDKALGKIEEKTYGQCESCGEDIAIARLEARPVAELCIDCKTEQESVERRYSSQEEEDSADFDEGEA
ncbi:MAG: TraR/DksA C4-type zinc finger protein [bacterium]|nr:TraR/DksA C4-type zinc finger protein [bacterium]